MAMITSYWTLDSLMILITLVLAAYLYMTRKFNYWIKRGVFEIKPLPFFGNLMNAILFKESPGFVLRNLYNKSKGQRYIGFYMLDKPCLLIRDRKIIKNILVKDFNNFCNRVSYTHSNDLMGRSTLVFLKNPTWKLLRRKLTPMFTSDKLKKIFDLLMKCTVNLDTYLDTLGLDEKKIAIDVKDIFGNLITDMIGSTAYGLNIDSVNNPECDFRKRGRAIFEFNILRGLELFAIFFYPDISHLFHVNFFGRQNIHFLRNVFWNAINGRIKSGEKRNDLIDILIDFRKKYAGQDLGEFQIQDRLREEILDAFIANDGKITCKMILSLPYLNMVFSETLRKYPILTTLNREALDTYKVADSNLVIEKNMPVFISLLGLHFDPEYFPNPEKYDPERFNKENIHKIPPYVYMPFGEGFRKCIGARLGILQTKLALVKFLSQYEVTPCEKTLIPMVIDPKGTVTSPLGGKIWLNVRKINTNTYVITKMALITSYLILDTIMIVIITIVVAAYFFMTRKFNYWKKRGVTEIKPLPFMGNIGNFLLQKQSIGFILKDFYDRSKGLPYIGFYVFDKPCLLILDQELIKHVLVKDFNKFCDHHSTSSSQDRIGHSSVLFIKNPTWKTVRNNLTPLFTSGKLKKMFNLLVESVVNLDSYLDKLELNGEGKEMEVRDLCGNLTTNMIGSTAYGLNIDSVNDPECEFRRKGKQIFTSGIFRGFELFLVFFYPEISRFVNIKFFGNAATNFLRNVFWDTINHRLKSGDTRDDLIDILIQLRKQYGDQDFGDFKFNGDDLVAQAAIFFTGGTETTLSAMSFALYELAMQPQFQDRLREEILNAINENEGKITYDMILSLPYLDMVVCETMRLYPIIENLDRETVESYKIPNSDLVIEKGTPIYISLRGMHYDPEYFPNPEKYDPERFSEENRSKIPPYAYIPFGEGPRKCIGIRLGLLQTKLGIVKLLSKYEVTPTEKTHIPMTINRISPITMPTDNKIYLKLRKLSTSAQ
ncbi:uncharacterized protein LOC116847451 [Odontomachus brunneus]|uniref:uncharacterized protein LOC116847451 n=1 Tax=Odontomachus brunneus TaxID=486640 RepID=UPI0013F2722E|nr:uncharacterized protein LOC116847451 [Odontomachus brunneus]